MLISRDPAAAAGDLNAALDALAIDLAKLPTVPVTAPEQQDFSAFYHS
jgi:hypothetical protein